MGAARAIFALAGLGIVAGACLAVATTPSFAPYAQRPRTARPVLADAASAPDEDAQLAQAPRYAPEYGYTPVTGDLYDDLPDDDYGPADGGYAEHRRPRHEHEGLRFAVGPQHRTVILELPRWMADSGEWMELGRRALREWEGRGDVLREDYAPRFEQRRSDDERLTERQRYGARPLPQAPAPYVQAPAPYAQTPRDERSAGPVTRQGPAQPFAGDTALDAAAQAAQRARDAARDVRAAEGTTP